MEHTRRPGRSGITFAVARRMQRQEKHARLGVACHHSQSGDNNSRISAHVVRRRAENGRTRILAMVDLHVSAAFSLRIMLCDDVTSTA
jgi:hypothetical protein